MKAYWYGLLITVQFFSIIPVRKNIPMTAANLERAIRMFPLFGLFLGTLYAALFYSLNEWTILSAPAVAFAVWLSMIIVTGGIHLDGWMDASDAFFSYQDVQNRLEIMKDPRTGAFGVLSIIVLLSARFLFIYEITQRAEVITYLLVICIPFLSRMVMGMVLGCISPAKKDGLGYVFKQACVSSSFVGYLVYIITIVAVMGIWYPALLVPFLLMLLVAVVYFGWIRKKIMWWFGGTTGDVTGAATEGVEVCLWLIVWLYHYYGMA